MDTSLALKRRSKSSVFLITSDGQTLRLPIPSQSPYDPLRWSLLKRSTVMAVISLFTVVGLVLVQGTSLLLSTLEMEYTADQIKPLRLDVLSSVPTLCWGIGALTWVPLSMAIGRRPVFILATFILTGGALLAAISSGFYTHLIARCLQGIAGAVSPSTMILTVIDLTYIHQRPNWIALFWCMTTVLSDIGLAFTPHIVSLGGTWRSFYWAWLAPCILLVVLALFCAPETSFQRPPMAFDGHIISQAETGKITLYNTWEEVPGGKPMPAKPGRTWEIGNFIRNIIFGTQQETGGWKAMKIFPRQLLFCAINPLVLWTMVLNTFVFGGMVITCQTYAVLLTLPPYNFTFFQIGLAKLSPSFGAFLAYPISGVLTTYLIRALASRNRGVREPEQYLPSFFLPIIFSSVSLILFGIAAERKWSASWILLFVGLDYLAAIATFSTNVVWITESFPEWAGAAIVVVGAGSYGTSFWLSSASVPWIQSQGLMMTYVQLGILTLVVGVFGFPVGLWGKRYREYACLKWRGEVVSQA